MGSIRTNPLRAFDGIYQIAGGARGLNTIENETPIQLVADVQRMADIGSGFGNFWGFVNISLLAEHDADTAVFATADPYDAAIMATLQTRAETTWAWCMDISGRMSVNLTLAAAGVLIGFEQAVITGAFTTHFVPLAFYDTELTRFIDVGAGGPWNTLGGSLGVGMVPLPRLIPPGSTIGMRSSVTAAIADNDVIGQLLMWYGPRGVLPPRVA